MARLLVRGLSKSFGSNVALRDAGLEIEPGEVHGLVGQNGSGKSTLVKLLSGYHTPDAGQVRLDDEPLSLPPSPSALRRRGLSVVHQDLGLVDSCSVVENIRIGAFRPLRLTRAIRWSAESERAAEALALLGQEIDPAVTVGSLSAAERASVAIARAVQDHEPGRGLILFDESSRALASDTLAHFHELIRGVTARGGSVLLISHRLEEVLAVADRVTVLRDGLVVGHGLDADVLSEHDLIQLVLGRELEDWAPAERPARRTVRRSLARVEGVRGRVLRRVSFTVDQGEVVGVTGLLGSGFEELPYLLAGARSNAGGVLDVGGRSFDLAKASPRELVAAGVVLVPERRTGAGLALSMSVRDNVTIPRVRQRGSRLRTDAAREREEVDRVIRELDVRPPEPELPVGHLSGGNQQKVMLGKWLAGDSRLLLLHEPTQGVDVGARRDLLAAIFRAAGAGAGVIVAGMDPGELALMCDRVLIVRHGELAQELNGRLSADEIVATVYGMQADVV